MKRVGVGGESERARDMHKISDLCTKLVTKELQRGFHNKQRVTQKKKGGEEK